MNRTSEGTTRNARDSLHRSRLCPHASTHLALPPGRSVSWCSWQRWMSRCLSEGRTALRCSRQGHRNSGVTLARPSSKPFDTSPPGQLPKKLGKREGKMEGRTNRGAIVWFGAEGCKMVLSVCFSLKKLPGPKTLEDRAGSQETYSVRSRPRGLPSTQHQGQSMQEKWRSPQRAIPYLFRHEAPSYPPAA